MRKIKSYLWIFILFIMSMVRADAAEMTAVAMVSDTEESDIVFTEEPKNLYAQSAALIDADSGRVLFEKNGDKKLPMASTTKIMTCITALENGSLDDVVTISKEASRMPDVQLNAREGEEITLRNLLYSLMLESHNDSAYAIAEHIGGSTENFAKMMNEKAIQLDCKDTYFITPNGLDAADSEGIHSTTAVDLARIMRYCIKESNQREIFLEITRTQSYSFTDISGKYSYSCSNHNAFLTMMEGALSGKTGFTGNAGYCYVGALERDGKTFIVSLLACGWPNNKTYKWNDTKKLMNYGLDYYKFCSFGNVEIDKGKLKPIIVENGQTKKIGKTAIVGLVVKAQKNGNTSAISNPISLEGVLIREGEALNIEYNIKKDLYAPVKKGDIVGTIQYVVGGEVWKTDMITTDSSVNKIDYKWCFRQAVKMFFVN